MSTSIAYAQENIDILESAQARKIKNLAFFKSFHPGIYNRFFEYKLDKYCVSLITDNNQLDILEDGKSIYDNMPISKAKEEVYQFKQAYSEGKRLRTISPPWDGYIYPSVFHTACRNLILKSPINKHNYQGYIIPDFYPLIAFNGVGAGYHIDLLLTNNSVLNALIFEPDEEMFAASLYIQDWEDLCRPFIDNPERSIHFIIGPFINQQQTYAHYFKYMIEHCPIYPLTTLFINHRNLKSAKMITEKLNEDTNAFASIWGFYDDEIYQINNCLHNVNLEVPVIVNNQQDLVDIPVFIIGAGPSLDDRIEDIRKNKGKALIISCGSAIHTLYHHNIKPDIQLELESHLITMRSLEELKDQEWVKDIPLIGPSQLAPTVFNYFKNKAFYFKGESVTTFLFGRKGNIVDKGTPSCANAGISVFLNWGFKNLYLFGVDFGYKDLNNHHAKGSVYYDTEQEILQIEEDLNKEHLMDIDCVTGGKIKSTAFMFTCKRTAENSIQTYENKSRVYNCSDGAHIPHTIHLTREKFNDIEIQNNERKIERFNDLQFYQNSNKIEKSTVEKRIGILEHNLTELTSYLSKELGKMDFDLYSLTAKINQLSNFMETRIKPEIPPFYHFIRGTVWHLFYIGYSHALSISDEKELRKWIRTWNIEAIRVFNFLPGHFSSVVHKEYDLETDHWTWTYEPSD